MTELTCFVIAFSYSAFLSVFVPVLFVDSRYSVVFSASAAVLLVFTILLLVSTGELGRMRHTVFAKKEIYAVFLFILLISIIPAVMIIESIT